MRSFLKIVSLVLVITCFSVLFLAGCGKVNEPESSSVSDQGSSLSQTSSSVAPESSSPAQTSIRDLNASAFDLDASNARTVYCIGDTFTGEGISASAKLANGSKFALYDYEYTLTTDFDSSKVGKYTATYTYLNFDPVSVDIYVAEKPQAQSGKVEFLLDASYTGEVGAINAQGQAQYSSVAQAVNMATYAGLSNEAIKEFIFKPGKFVDKVTVPSSIKNMIWTGSTEGDSIVSYGDCAEDVGGTDKSASVTIKASGFKATNIVFENSFDYINSEKGSKQALALQVEGDKCIFEDCTFLGYQDTLQAKNGRHYYKNCTIKGSTDFIFGKSATCIFDNCDIVSRFTGEGKTNNGYITAHTGTMGDAYPEDKTKFYPGQKYGYVFLNCRITAEEGVGEGTVSLGRPWGPCATVAYINCELGAHISKLDYTGSGKPRYDKMDSRNPQDANFVEYGNSGLGAITEAVVGCTMLTKEQADEYTFANIFAKENGTKLKYADEWNPLAK